MCDIVLEHPSASKQQAVVQYRLVENKQITPYLLDLESANETFLNGSRVESSRYYELRSGDVVKFGHSSRDYVFMKE